MASRGRPRGARAVVVQRVRELHAQGLNGVQIAEQTGISRSHVYGVLSDPTGAADRERKRKYDGVCVDCGGRTVGDGNRNGPPKRCADCAKAHQIATKKWTREAVIAAIREWARTTGEPPTATGWNTTLQSLQAGERFRSGCYPTTNTVVHVFGSWNAAIKAAGFTPRTRGSGPRLTAEDTAATRDMYLRGTPVTEIAAHFAVTGWAIRQRLQRMGITNDRRQTMAAPLRAEQIIDREVERAENAVARLESDLAAARDTLARLQAAREALNAPPVAA